jgi:hypothetical protein
MCPLCISSVALTVAGAATGMGFMSVIAAKWRKLRRIRREA